MFFVSIPAIPMVPVVIIVPMVIIVLSILMVFMIPVIIMVFSATMVPVIITVSLVLMTSMEFIVRRKETNLFLRYFASFENFSSRFGSCDQDARHPAKRNDR